MENTDNPDIPRADGLKIIGQIDAANAKAYATKFENDKGRFVRNEALKIIEGKK